MRKYATDMKYLMKIEEQIERFYKYSEKSCKNSFAVKHTPHEIMVGLVEAIFTQCTGR